nr:pectinesterase inhibitor 10-like [Aegilops tauschii subsp. strangulata]
MPRSPSLLSLTLCPLCLAPLRTRERRSAPPQNTAPTTVPLLVAVTLSSAQAPRTPTPNHSSPDDPKTTLRFFFPVHGRRMQLPDSPSSTRPRARFDAPCNLRELLFLPPLSNSSFPPPSKPSAMAVSSSSP